MKQPDIDWEIEVPATDEDFVYKVYLKNSSASVPIEVGAEGTYNQALRKASRNLRQLARELEEEIKN